MSDLIFLALVLGFFALAAALLRACEHIIGPDDRTPATPATSVEDAADRAMEVPA